MELVNRVASSGLVTLNLEEYFPKEERLIFDIKDYLFMGLILKEKDFRAALELHDWTQYKEKTLLVYCSADAIIPVWAYMLVSVCAAPHANNIFQGDEETYLKAHYYHVLESLDLQRYAGQRIVIKGCSEKPVPPAAYLTLSKRLQPLAKSIMYGEPCSTVPIFKKPKETV